MSLSLLLDENISPEIFNQIKEKLPDIIIETIYIWREGIMKSQPDEVILDTISSERLTLVTYDQKTILPILMRWGYSGKFHAGVIFVDDRSISSKDYGGFIRAITEIWDLNNTDDWMNRVAFLGMNRI